MKTILKQICHTIDAAIAAAEYGDFTEAVDRLNKLNDLVNAMPDDNLQEVEEQKTVEQHSRKAVNYKVDERCSCTCFYAGKD